MTNNKKSKSSLLIAVKLMKQGKNSSFIIKYLLDNYKDVTSIEEAKKVIIEANNFIKNEYETDFKNIWLIHVNRYKNEIERLLKTEELSESEIGRSVTYEQWIVSRNKKVKAYDQAMNVMKQLENILQLHDDNCILELNEEIEVNIDTYKPKWNVGKLTDEEQVELYYLILKAKKKEGEPQSVKEATFTPQTVTEAIAYEIIEDVNLDHIKQVQIESQELTPSNYINPTYKLREALKKLAAKSFKNAGSSLNEEEEKLLEN